jgi:RsiW-degrading membrane proteinase PrsW (M82 family)
MTQQNYPIPPPPPPTFETPTKKTLHGPGTNFFPSIKANLTTIENVTKSVSSAILKKGAIIGLILAATLSFALSFVAQLAVGIPASNWALIGLIAPFTEEIFKGLSILLVAIFIWKTIPSCRHGALLGAATGLGFSIAENIVYSISYASISGQVVNGQVISGGYVAELIISRWIAIPFMHVLWSAFVGIGIFVLLSQGKNAQIKSLWLVVLFSLFGLGNHILWNSLALASGGLSPFVITVIDILLIFTPFAIIFRDFIGGHFNFQDFLRPVKSPTIYQQINTFPPPPPPPQTPT